MPSFHFQFQNSTLHYDVVGAGPHPILLFHGFGQDYTSFNALSGQLSQHYTAYIFDLYFHGSSHWGYGEQPLNKHHWKETLQAFFKQHNIDKFSLGAYSLGGKLALAALEAFPNQVQGMILLAPDGIKTSFWYNIATYPILGRWLFKSMIIRPKRFETIVSLLKYLKLADKGLLKFAAFQMNTQDKRKRVYYSWVVFRRLRFNLQHVAGIINEHKIPVILVVGRFDKMIAPKDMQRFVRQVPHCIFETPETGHTGLIAASEKHFHDLHTLMLS